MANLLQTYAPSMFMPTYTVLPKPVFPAGMTQGTYGMGWWDGEYRGYQMISHGGNTIGHSALNVLFPGINIGISILTNQNGLGLPHLEIVWYAMDLLLGYQPWLNINNTCNFPCGFIKCKDKKTTRKR